MADPARADHAGGEGLQAALGRCADHDPGGDAVAVAGGPTLSYQAWRQRSAAVAHALAAAGVRSASRVVLVFDNARWTDYAVAYAAVRAVGAVAVPCGPRPTRIDVARVVGRHSPVLVVGPPDLLPDRPDLPDGPDGLGPPTTDIGALEAGGGALGADGGAHVAEANADGETGVDLLVADGAMRPAGGWWHPSPADGTDGADGAGGRGPLVHAFPLGSGPGQDALLHPLRQRATAIVLPRFEPNGVCSEVDRRGATALGLPPFLARCLVESGALARHPLPSLRSLLIGPGRASPSVLTQLAEALPGVEIVDDVGARPPGAGWADLPDAAPLASSQDGMVWHEQFAPGSFNLAPLVRRYRGRLDVDVLGTALNEIVSRHDALRARFQVAEGRCVQTFPPAGHDTLGVTDLSGLAADHQEAALARALAQARNQPFDLVTGPLFEPRLLRLGADDHVLVVRAHHSVFDDWSVSLFRRELSGLYTALVGGRRSPLPELPTTFAAACRRQREAIDGARGAAERSFWAEELRGAPLSTELPLDDPARPVGSPHRAADPLTVNVAPEVVAALRQLARRERSTLFMVLLAAFSALVYRCQDTDDVVLSTLAANRNRTELENLIGCFAKKVLVRVRAPGDPSFTELVRCTRAALVGAMAHQDLAYEAVLQDSLGPDATAHGLAPQVSLKFQSAVLPTARLSLPGVTAGPLELRKRVDRPAHFLSGESEGAGAAGERPPWGCGLYSGTFLGLSAAETEAGLALTAEGVFHPPAVARMLGQYQTVLAAVAAEPSLAVSKIDVVDAGQRAEVERLSVVAAEAPPGTFAELLAAVADRVPDRPAVIAGERRLTYGELKTAVGRSAEVGAAVATWLTGGAGLVPDGAGAGGAGAPAVDDAVVGVWTALGPTVYGDGDERLLVHTPGLEDPRAFVRSMAALLGGHTMRLGPRAADGGTRVLLEGLEEGTLDVVECSPSELSGLLEAGLPDAVARRRATGKRAPVVVLAATGPVAGALWRLWRGLDGADGVCVYTPPGFPLVATAGRAAALSSRPTVGPVAAGVTCRVLDGRGGLAPLQVVGALHVGRAAPPGEVATLQPTGELARLLPDGSIELLGRASEHGDLRGFHVDLRRLEEVLAGHPSVADVGVAIQGDGPHEEPRLVAAVVPAPGAAVPDLGRLRRFLWAQLPGYAWPARMVVVDAVPRHPDGRMDADVLPGPGAPEPATGDLRERTLAAAWSEAAADDRDPEANYWQSFSFLDALALAAGAGLAVPGRQVTRNRTVQALAADLDADPATGPRSARGS